jgi:hypothetical protein
VREIRTRPVEVEGNDAQARAGEAAELVDGSPPALEIRDHLGRHGGRIGRHALRDDAVVAGKDQHVDPVEARHGPALPARQPEDDILEPAEASRRLRQARLPRGGGGGGILVAG